MQVRVRDQLTEMYLKRVRLFHNNGKKQLKELQDKYRPLNEMMIDAFTQTEHIKRFGEYFIELDNVPPPLQPDKRFLSVEMA